MTVLLLAFGGQIRESFLLKFGAVIREYLVSVWLAVEIRVLLIYLDY